MNLYELKRPNEEVKKSLVSNWLEEAKLNAVNGCDYGQDKE
uniref:Uncharacterized protein n=1 Tax=Tetranychus urticae TaxID=32264 RepID=T1K3F0_TETUR